MGIGQSYWTVTPIQLTKSITTLVNHGQRYIPQILRGKYIDKELVFEGSKERRPMDIQNVKNWDTVLDAMYGVVNRKIGTARRAFVDTPYVSLARTMMDKYFEQREFSPKPDVIEREVSQDVARHSASHNH